MSELSLNVVSNEALKMREKKKRKVKKIKRQCEIRERKGKERKEKVSSWGWCHENPKLSLNLF